MNIYSKQSGNDWRNKVCLQSATEIGQGGVICGLRRHMSVADLCCLLNICCCRLRKVKMAQRKLHESANTLVDMAKVCLRMSTLVHSRLQSQHQFAIRHAVPRMRWKCARYILRWSPPPVFARTTCKAIATTAWFDVRVRDRVDIFLQQGFRRSHRLRCSSLRRQDRQRLEKFRRSVADPEIFEGRGRETMNQPRRHESQMRTTNYTSFIREKASYWGKKS